MVHKIKLLLGGNTIKRRLLLFMSWLFILSSILIALISHLRFTSQYQLQSAQNTQQLVEQTALNIENYLDEVARLCLSPYYNTEIMSQLETLPQNPQEALSKKRNIEDYLGQVMTQPRKDILRVSILSDVIYSSGRSGYQDIHDTYQEESWFQSAYSSLDYIYIPAEASETDPSYSVFSIAKQLCSLDNNSNILGVIRVDANYNGIKKVCDRITVSHGGAFFLMDSCGDLIYSHSELLPGIAAKDFQSVFPENGFSSVTLDGSSYLLNAQTIPTMGWTLVSVNLVSELTKSAHSTLLFNLLLALGIAILGILLSRYSIGKRLRPLYQTVEVMEQVQAGNLSIRAKTVGTDEIAYLNKAFNQMLDQIQQMIAQENELAKQVYEAKYLQKKAQFDALYHQIRPHFLFNTLNSLSLLIKCGYYPEAVSGIEQLATLLRGMVNSNREITLNTELKITESYLKLEQLRHDALQYQIIVPDPLPEYHLPALTIQPLVENALLHGFQTAHRRSEILITILLQESCLKISVQDNGDGMSSAALTQLQEKLNDYEADSPFSQSGIGLINIQKRLQIKYKNQGKLEIRSREGAGTTVTLSLPLND